MRGYSGKGNPVTEARWRRRILNRPVHYWVPRCLGNLHFTDLRPGDDDDDEGAVNRAKRPIEALFKTDVVHPEEEGVVEVALGSTFQNHTGGIGGDTWTIPFSLEYGITGRWQAEVEWDSFVQRSPPKGAIVRGIGDLELSTQYSFMNIGDSPFHLAPRFSFQIPVGNVNKDLGDGFLAYRPAVIIARDFPALHHAEVFAEIGANFVQRADRSASAADVKPAAHELNLASGCFILFPHGAATLEFTWGSNEWNHHGAVDEMYVTPGYLWKAARNVEVGLGIPLGLNNGADRFDVITHVVYEF